MASTIPVASESRSRGIFALRFRPELRLILAVIAGLVILGVTAAWLWSSWPEPPARPKVSAVRAPQAQAGDGSVRLSKEQQQAIGLRTATITSEPSFETLTAPGKIAPNEVQYAYITPRAPGVVRSVVAHVGQDVKAGDLLATIDSPQVGEARLELYTRLQTLEIARSQADWQSTIYRNTVDLLDRLRRSETPDEIHDAFKDRAVGENREKLMTAYAQFRLASAKIDRNRELHEQKLITPKRFEEVVADYQVARATYHGLMDQMGYEVRLANTRALQALKQAETSVRAAREHLRILGVKSDGTEPEVQQGKVVGVKPDGTLPARDAASATEVKPEPIVTPGNRERRADVKPVGVATGGPDSTDAPVSTYSIWAPFDGTILEREMIVPGVAVDTTHRIFTLANLSTVWIEASVHENDFPLLARTSGSDVRLLSPAYPGQVFTGKVIYTGDLVEEKSRAIKLLARAENPQRLLKPGMFVEVEILRPGDGTVARVPTRALLTEGSRTFVYVRTGPDTFIRREIECETQSDETATVRAGLEPGDEVVTLGGAKLKALDAQLALNTLKPEAQLEANPRVQGLD
jgi:membrane fusion protein, heavy metal efflux system